MGRNGDAREPALSRQPNLWEISRGLFEHNLADMLRPRSRAEHHLIEELLMPARFHRLLFTARPLCRHGWIPSRSSRGGLFGYASIRFRPRAGTGLRRCAA